MRWLQFFLFSPFLFFLDARSPCRRLAGNSLSNGFALMRCTDTRREGASHRESASQVGNLPVSSRSSAGSLSSFFSQTIRQTYFCLFLFVSPRWRQPPGALCRFIISAAVSLRFPPGAVLSFSSFLSFFLHFVDDLNDGKCGRPRGSVARTRMRKNPQPLGVQRP